MAIKRLTQFFFTTKEDNFVPTEVNGVGTVNAVVYKTNLPFKFDPELALVRSIRNSDVPIDANGNQSLDPEDVYSYGTFSSSSYLVAIGKNGRIIYDGLTLTISNGRIVPPTSGYLAGGIGLIKIIQSEDGKELRAFFDSNQNTIGVVDSIEIALVSSSAYSPWIYFGNTPTNPNPEFDEDGNLIVYKTREQIAKELGKNRSPKGMGGIPESLVPSQAIGYRYYVDLSLENLAVPILIPFPSAFLIGNPAGAVGFTSADAFFMGDVLDNDGSLAVRSNVSFRILATNLSATLVGFAVPVINTINTGAFKNINYKEIDYNQTTYLPEKKITNTNLYLAFHNKQSINDFNFGLGEIFNIINSGYIDFETTTVYVYSFENQASIVLEGSVDTDAISSAISSIQSENENSADLDNLISLVRGSAQSDYSSDLGAFLSDGNSFGSFSKQYSIIISSDMAFVDGQEDVSSQSMIANIGGVDYSRTLNVFGAKLILDQAGNENDASVAFGSNVSNVNAYKGSGAYALEYANIMVEASGVSLSSSDPVVEEGYVSGNTLRTQCNSLVQECEFCTDTDRDNDGKITLLDRITSLYFNFNPGANTGDTRVPSEFFGDRASEMRYWRKTCPIGQLYQFKGQILEITEQTADNFLLKVKIVDYDEEGNLIFPGTTETEDNYIYVCYEAGAVSNASGLTDVAESGNVFEFRGRLFLPKYLYGATGSGILLGNGLNLTDIETLTAWYRLRSNTCADLLQYGSPGADLENEPIVVVRSNIYVETNSTFADGVGTIQNTFKDTTITPQFYSISQVGEAVEDHILVYDLDAQEEEYQLDTTGRGNAVKIWESATGVPVSLGTISFEIELPSTLDVSGEFEYELLYDPLGDGNLYQFGKFWSATGFTTITQGQESVTSTVVLNPSVISTFTVRDAITDDESLEGRLFDITFSAYRLHQLDNEGIRYRFKWDTPDVWQVSVGSAVNDTNYSLQISSDFSDSGFLADAKIDPATGQLFLNEALQEGDKLIMSARNIASGQNLLKTGTAIYLSLVSRPEGAEITPPTIRNVQVNVNTEKGYERVDVNYSNPAGTGITDRNHWLAPAWGYVMLSSRNWSLNLEDWFSRAGGTYSTRVVGTLDSPVWFFDAFSDSIPDKTITRGDTGADIPAIDIVVSNLISAGVVTTQPYMEILSVGFEAPPPDLLPKIASHFSPVSNKYSIIFNRNEFLNKKFSYTQFKDRDTQDNTELQYERKSLRESIPITMGVSSLEELEFSGDIENGVDFSVDRGGRTIAGISVSTQSVGDINDVTQPLELYANAGNGFEAFGFENFSGQKFAKMFGITSAGSLEGQGEGYTQIPDASNVSQLRVKKPDELSDIGEVTGILGEYVSSYLSGQSPSIFETRQGEYLLFFANEGVSSSQIYGVISHHNGRKWKRPDTRSEDETYDDPIVVLDGFVNPVVIYEKRTDLVHIFAYNNLDFSINYVTLPLMAFKTISEGADSSQEGNEETNVEFITMGQILNEIGSTTNSIQDFYNKGRSIRPVFFQATEDFAAEITSTGIIFVANVTLSGDLRVVYSRDYTSDTWTDIGVNLLDENSFLSQVVSSEQIVSMSLGFDEINGEMHLLISTSDNRLIGYKIPEEILRVNQGQNASIEEIQNVVNSNKPTLIVGKLKGNEGDSIVVEGFIDEDFPPQIVNILWLPTGQGYLLYIQDNRVRAIKTSTGARSWSIDENI